MSGFIDLIGASEEICLQPNNLRKCSEIQHQRFSDGPNRQSIWGDLTVI
jgi:hypothetical protein